MRRPATSTCCTIARLIKCGEGARENLLDHGRLRIRVVLHVLPLLRAELALRPLVELSVRVVRAQPIAEEQHSIDLGTLSWKDVQVHGWLGASKHPVLEPVRFANAENVTHRLKLRDVRLLVGRVGDDEVDVDARFRHQPRHRGGADVMDLKCRATERASNLFGCLLEERRPARVVLNEHDLLVGRHFTDRCGPDLFVVHPPRVRSRVVQRDLPSGTVTFLFTDVEGSTKLLHELGADAYSATLLEHRRILRDTFTRHGGVEVDTQGDAFFIAFPTERGAVDAAREAQDALLSGPIRVRIGIHTGTPNLSQEGYVGHDVQLGARIAAAGHGGQVLLSKETRELAEIEATDLGEHRLKDFDEPISIFQLGKERFPPLKTISNTNLPHPASSFVGREAEVKEVVSRLQDGVRLLTLTGPGGSGKTRLAIEAAATLVPQFKAGVFWVGLATLRDPALAAARASVLSPKQILERLSQRLDVLKGGRDADPRQQTLRATIAWSHDLLDAGEQQLFARLAVFAGGCTLEAAGEVLQAQLDTLQSLVDKSLVRHTAERFWMLETIREYAAEQLEDSGEVDERRRRHAEWFLALAEDAYPHLRGSPTEWLNRLEREHDNLRAALDRLEASGETQLALQLA